MRVAFVGMGTPTDRSAWSGVPFYALRALRERFSDLHVVDTPFLDRYLMSLAPLVHFGIMPLREAATTRLFETVIRDRMRALKPDLVISIGAGHKVSRLDPALPLIHVADGMFSTMLDYYSRYARVSDRTRALGERVQADLVNRSRAVALASDWAAAGAAASFPCAAARLHVVPMGANLDDPPPPAPPRGASGPLRLLFVGYDWQRKGGAIILPVFEALRRRLPDTELHIVGGAAPATRGVAGIVHHGILRKAVPAEAATLAGLFEHSNLFFMPSREEAFGLVYCEACAYGLPSIATRTGGVPTYVDERRHGMLFDPDAPVEDYVEGIVALWSDAPRYAAMQVAARLDYETRLNWQSWAAAIETLALAVA